MLCAISGEVPQEAVVSTKSGHVFEKRLLHKYIEAEGKDPVTGEPLSIADLIEVKSAAKSVRPRPLAATSIPGMIAMFQNEWDELMLETYTLKQHLHTARQQLSEALYQNDAACRVIARLISERDEARSMLSAAQLSNSYANGSSSQAMETQSPRTLGASSDRPGTGSDDLVEAVIRMQQKADELSSARKERKVAAVDSSRLSQWRELDCATPHTSSTPGILSVDVALAAPHLLLTGGVDKTAALYDRSSKKVVARLIGHAKRVTHALFHPDFTGDAQGTRELILTCSADKTVKLWTNRNDSYEETATYNVHADEVTCIAIQPVGDYVVSMSLDNTWALHDIRSNTCLAQVTGERNAGFTCGAYHPDGLILGTGTRDGLVRIWDARKNENAATFAEHASEASSNDCAVRFLCFSENGYTLATAAGDDCVRLFDLRKLKLVQTVPAQGGVAGLAFDQSGKLLAFGNGAGSVSVATAKPWNVIAKLEGPTNITGLKFGPSLEFLACVAMDRTLRVYGQEDAMETA